MGYPGGSGGKEFTCKAGDLGSIPVSETSLGVGDGYPLQYSCLENPMDEKPGISRLHWPGCGWPGFLQL